MLRLSAAGLVGALPRVLHANVHPAKRCFDEFNNAVKDRPELDPWRSINVEELPPVQMTLHGKVPKGLNGTLYRNGPAQFERAGMRYQHWFDGDGMIQAFRFANGRIVHRGRKVATAKWKAEENAGRFLNNGAGSLVPEPIGGAGPNNPANISVVPWGDHVLALWEAGSPYALDPTTLETKERVVWSPKTDSMPFSAHPLVESDGRMWNFGLAQWSGPTGALALYALSPKRGLERMTLLELPFPGYMHSFAMSRRWLVFYLAPHVFSRGHGRGYVDSHSWEPNRGGRILLVDKNDFAKRRWLDAPAGFIFHFADARDRTDGGLAIRAVWAAGPDTMSREMYSVMCGQSSRLDDGSTLVTFTVSSKGSVSLEPTKISGEFPIVDARGESEFVAMTHQRELKMLTSHGKLRRFKVPGRVRLEEHRFVPRANQLGDGWLVGTGYDVEARQSVVTVFDTASRSSAPVVLARMDRRIPFGFHGWFMKA